MTTLQSGEAWPPFQKKWGGFGPPGPPIATPMLGRVEHHVPLTCPLL